MIKLKLPEDCIKNDVCKYFNDNGCWNGCEYRVEKSIIKKTLTDFGYAADNLRMNGLSDEYFEKEAEILRKSKEDSERVSKEMEMSDESMKRKFTI